MRCSIARAARGPSGARNMTIERPRRGLGVSFRCRSSSHERVPHMSASCPLDVPRRPGTAVRICVTGVPLMYRCRAAGVLPVCCWSLFRRPVLRCVSRRVALCVPGPDVFPRSWFAWIRRALQRERCVWGRAGERDGRSGGSVVPQGPADSLSPPLRSGPCSARPGVAPEVAGSTSAAPSSAQRPTGGHGLFTSARVLMNTCR